MRAAPAIVVFLLVAGCSYRPAFRPGGDFAAWPEKRVFLALKEVRADDQQRVKVLQSYDASQPRLLALGDEAQSLLGQWHELDRRGPSFPQRSAELAERWGAVARQRMALSAEFEGQVAAVLDEAQWRAWQAFGMRPAFRPRDGGPPEGGQRRRGGGHAAMTEEIP